MKRAILFSIGFIVTCGWLATGIAFAAPPNGPRAGGLPLCEEELLLCLEMAQAFPATGQESCWDYWGSPIDCAGTGHDGDIRAGAPLDYTDTGLTIIDNNTQLEWQKQDDNGGFCGGYPGTLSKDCNHNWLGAFWHVATLNANNHAGYSDWRVPNVKELHSIVNYENFFPAVSEAFHDTEGEGQCTAGCTVETCSCTAGWYYWSSTSLNVDQYGAWHVEFTNGLVGGTVKTDGLRVRAVRGGLID